MRPPTTTQSLRFPGPKDQAHQERRRERDEYIERKVRETRLSEVAPISTTLILSHLATHVLGPPKSF
jgi:hypothetical protein